MKRYFIVIILFISQSVGQQYLYNNLDSLKDEFMVIHKEINSHSTSSNTLKSTLEAIEPLRNLLSLLTLHHSYRRIIIKSDCECSELKESSNNGMSNASKPTKMWSEGVLLQLDIYKKYSDNNIEKELLERCINNVKLIKQELEIQLDSL
mgnify:CR=1 FL=1